MFSIIESLWNNEYCAVVNTDAQTKYKKDYFEMSVSKKSLKNKIGSNDEILNAFKDFDLNYGNYQDACKFEAFKAGFTLASVLFSEVMNNKLLTLDDEEKELRNSLFFDDFDSILDFTESGNQD